MKLPKIHLKNSLYKLLPALVAAVLTFAVQYYFLGTKLHQDSLLQQDLKTKLSATSTELSTLKATDQIKRNDQLQQEINNIETTYNRSTSYFERIQDLKVRGVDTKPLDTSLAQALRYLADKNFSSGSATLADLDKAITDANNKLAASAVVSNIPSNNSAPVAGYQRQTVSAGGQNFMVDIIGADLSATKVIVDTASSSDCSNNCPVLPLADYVARSGAFAGINGSFFCPDSYPSCAGRTNSFDTLLMNKDKHYFNSDNNVYSTIPAAIFSNGSARFVGRTLEWGRDTSVDSVIANYPMLIQGGNISYSGSANEPKFEGKGTRCFIAYKGRVVYIGVVYNATMVEAAQVLKTLAMDNAINLDEGGSTAFMVGGRYLAGPGRNLPNAVLFIKR